MWKGSVERRWRRHLEGINFGYALFAVALIWLCGLAYLGD
jgi:hypothetical protein